MLIGIIADIHEDLVRLQQALQLLKDAWCKKLVCLGDSVGYSVPYYWYLASRNGSEVIKLLQEHCAIIVAGNHDLYASKKIPAFTKDFEYPHHWFSLDYSERKTIANGRVWLYENNELPPLLSQKELQYLKNLPEYHIETFEDMNILFSHRLYPDFSGSTTRQATDSIEYQQHFDFMVQHHCSLSLVGHEHKMFRFTKDWCDDLLFGEKYRYDTFPCWFWVPSVANWTFPNGVILVDTKEKTIQWIPLWTPVHPSQAWRKL
jgi:predicted phosphodiesterase